MEKPETQRSVHLELGRVERTDRLEPPAHTYMVGRLSERRRLVDLLMTAGRRVAILITGHRGAGKTSFVKHCLAIAERRRHTRFLASNFARVLFWDGIALMALVVGATLFTLSCAELLHDLKLASDASKTPGASPFAREALTWLGMLPLAIIAIYPVLYARGVFRVVIEDYFKQTTRATSGLGSWLPTLVFAALPVFALIHNDVSAEAVASWTMFCHITFISLVYQLSYSKSPNQSAGACTWYITTLPPIAILFFTWLLPNPFEGLPDQAPLTMGLALLALAFTSHSQSTSMLCVPRTTIDQQTHLVEATWYDIAAAGTIVISVPLLLLDTSSDWDDVGEFFAPNKALGLFALGLLTGLCTYYVRAARCAALGVTGRRYWIATLTPSLSNLLVISAAYLAIQYCVCHPCWGTYITIATIFTCVTIHIIRLASLSRTARAWHRKPQDDSNKIATGSNGIFRPHARGVLFSKAIFATAIGSTLLTTSLKNGLHIKHAYTYTAIVAISVAVFHFVEYEWVAKGLSAHRKRQPESEPDSTAESLTLDAASASSGMVLSEHTLAWSYYRAMLPTITVYINLGFEHIENLRIIDTMLMALRQQVRRHFLEWRSMRATTGRVARFLLAAMLTTTIGDKWEHSESIANSQAHEMVTRFNDLLDAGFPTTKSHQPWHQRTYCLFLPCDRSDQSAIYSEDRILLVLRLHHLFWFAIVFAALVWIQRRLGMLPYREIVRRIDALHQRLSSRTTGTTRSKTGWKLPSNYATATMETERMEGYDTPPVDPRVVEVELLSILEDLHDASRRFPFSDSTLVSLPEVTVNFVFDELDKLGSRADVLSGDLSRQAQQTTLDEVSRRSVEVHKLFADMKNLLSNACARFLFVGGRNLHDEWLADAVARQPLLTNVFDHELYLPSLLVEGTDDSDEAILEPRGVREFLEAQLERARKLQGLWALKTHRPHIGLWHAELHQPAFRQVGLANSRIQQAERLLTLDDQLGTPLFAVRRHAAQRFISDFLRFLAFRSLGRPKKLNQLIEGLVVSASDLPTLASAPDETAEHYLNFDDTVRFRILLTSEIYTEIIRAIGLGNWRRDDRLLTSILMIADFLFKFHGRAFSWSNLERVDELANVHHAPDLRLTLRKLISHWTNIYLDEIRNGMYAFRFRSEVAQEIRYVSRRSATEEAAFNFTLDESQALKSLYHINIEQMREKAGVDAYSALGELYEFDADFDRAIHYYRVGLSILDVGEGDLASIDRDGDTLAVVLRRHYGSTSGGKSNVLLSWGLPRLRLKLQIGMSFERSHNFERALAEYHECSQLAHHLVELALGDDRESATSSVGVDLLKHLNLLIQPIFAESWVFEKMHGGVDTSSARVERAVQWFRSQLPFVNSTHIPVAANESNVPHSNFSLVMAEIHNKAADLYFLKGTQRAPFHNAPIKASHGGVERAGYLLQAHYHYCMGLHELRRFISYRRQVSGVKYGIYGDSAPTLLSGGWPDFALRAAGAALSAVAETGLARVSFLAVAQGHSWSGESTDDISKIVKDSYANFVEWMECAPLQEHHKANVPLQPSFESWRPGLGTIDVRGGPPRQSSPANVFGDGRWTFDSWLGSRNFAEEDVATSPQESYKMLTFSAEHHQTERLRASFFLWAIGTRVVIKSGHLSAAAAEYGRMADMALWYLWWSLISLALSKKKGEAVVDDTHGVDGHWRWLRNFACFAVSRSVEYHRRGWQARRPAGSSARAGEMYPLDLAITILGLQIVVPAEEVATHSELMRHYRAVASDNPAFGSTRTKNRIASDIMDLVTLFPYPVVARVKALIVLILYHSLSAPRGDPNAEIVSRNLIIQLDGLCEHLTSAWYPCPFDVGVAYAVHVIRFNDRGPLHRRAFDQLDLAEQMCTMRRAYYSSIAELYYLYDDFNDRQIHSVQARQMAAMDVIRLLKERLKEMSV